MTPVMLFKVFDKGHRMISRTLVGLLLALIASSAWSQNAVRGKQLYNTKLNPAYLTCSDPNVCHGADPNGNLRNIKKATNGSVILAAIGTQDLMKALNGFVNATDAADLAAYIVNPAAANGPAITLNGTTLTFASTQIAVTNSTSTPANLVLTNSGGGPLTITGIAKAGTNAVEFTATGSCVGASVTVAAGGTCTLGAAFTPMAAGMRTAILTLQSNAATNPTITLTGTAAAVATPSIARSVTSIVFNTQTVGTTSAARPVVVTNNGTLAVSITAAASTPTPEFASTGNCVGNLAPGASCTINVTFTPAATGARSGNVTITSSAAGSPHTIPLSGPGVTTPVGAATLSASALAFPATAIGATSTAQRTTLANTGNAALAISSVQIGGTHVSDFKMGAGSTCAAGSLAINATCEIEAEFKPQSAGSKSASVVISHGVGTASVALDGMGNTATSTSAGSNVAAAAPSSSALSPSNVGGGGAVEPWQLALVLLLPVLVTFRAYRKPARR
jgi:Cep192 domain 4